MTAQMWPEAMLIASFTDKEEYRVRLGKPARPFDLAQF
jgi:hypothetical protein